ncbi:Zinc metallo ase nas-39 [Paramuricea clavata]|uniref:Zinc metallo ase nas-39 n=1 Tax=Paramuricea clavata TaxID=317549 RepID=A0A6S7JW10_PARCT|nr:Zinc metallo ase nas-39 [Paramuricea clavata]
MVEQRNIQQELHVMDDKTLDKCLCQFYAEVKKQEVEDYSKSTLKHGLERYLNCPPYNRGFSMSSNPAFKMSNSVLNAKIVFLKKQGKANIVHKPVLEAKDLTKLKNSDILNVSTHLGLLRNVWFHVSSFWCRSGRERQRKLTKDSFVFTEDANGGAFVTMAHSEGSENHPGGIHDNESFENLGRMYKTDAENDGVSALQLFITKLHPSCEAFFQYPKRKWSPADSAWYENKPLGVNTLGNMMKTISEAASLSTVYTNHSVRETSIIMWSNAGLTNRHIMAISEHRSEQSLVHYNQRPSSDQLKRSSEVISGALGDNTGHNKPLRKKPAVGIVSQTTVTKATTIASSDLGSSSPSVSLQGLPDFGGCLSTA